MKKIKKIIGIVLIALVAIIATSCGKNEKKESIAMIIPIAQGDPFISLTYKGIEKLGKEKGIETKIIEALDKSEYSEQIRAMAEAGANPLYVIWDDLAAEAIKIAPEFPNTSFIIIDTYATTDLKNVKTIVVEPQEASFIAGVVAARTTKTKKVAWIGHTDMPVINRFRAGFEAGVKYADKTVSLTSVYVGDANDPNKGSELAKQVINQGVDIIMHSANKSGLGIIRAGEEMNVKVIGVDEWQGSINAEVVFWSALKDIGGATYQAGLSALNNTFVPGIERYNAQSGIDLYDSRDFNKLSSELKEEVLEVLNKIKTGEITVPSEIK